MTVLKIMEFVDKYSFVFSILYKLLACIIGFVIGKCSSKIKKHYIRRCLSLTKAECKIVIPSYGKKIHTNKIVQVCPIGDVKAASNIIDLIHKTGLYSHQNSIFYESNYNSKFENYNIFCIGGILANTYTYDIFEQFFPDFKIFAPEKKIKTNPNKIRPEHFVMCDREKGFCWGDLPSQQFIINDDERYAILVKLSNIDFNSLNHGTIHIIFGNGVLGTLAITKYLLYNYKDLYKMVKKKQHYFIAFKVKENTGIIDTSSFIDLTEEMFSKNAI